jgi:membrane glycosyltransferase
MPLSIFQRRAIYGALVALTMAALLWMTVAALSPGGFGIFDLLFLLFFAVTLPWTVIGFWNAVIGFIIMRFARDPLAAVNPPAAQIRATSRSPLRSRSFFASAMNCLIA